MKTETFYLTQNHEPGSPHEGKWLVEPGKCPFDPPGTKRWTRLIELAAYRRNPQDAAKLGGFPLPMTYNLSLGRFEEEE